MDEFPFSKEEWARVQDAATSVVNATLADDAILRQSLMNELERVLEALRRQYGDHPVLLETAADFQDTPTDRVDLYRSALKLAVQNHLPTCSIRISLARVLLEDFGEPRAAARELIACQDELHTNGDQSDLEEWAQLLSKCGRL